MKVGREDPALSEDNIKPNWLGKTIHKWTVVFNNFGTTSQKKVQYFQRQHQTRLLEKNNIKVICFKSELTREYKSIGHNSKLLGHHYTQQVYYLWKTNSIRQMIPLPKKIDEQSVQSKLTQETSNVNTKYSSENHLFSNFRKQSAKITTIGREWTTNRWEQKTFNHYHSDGYKSTKTATKMMQVKREFFFQTEG